MNDGGKYDPECELVIAKTGAAACALLVLGGDRGSGFSVTVDFLRAPGALVEIPSMLRAIAANMERQTPHA